jgi:MOSC domain-containing protein YiiM
MMTPRVVSVNVAAPASLRGAGQEAISAIGKTPVAGPVTAAGVNLAGDEQADRAVHGGADKAVYAYAVEDYTYWQAQLRGELGPAAFGENLTTTGMDLARLVIGQHLHIGTVTVQVTGPRVPCYKLGIHMNDAQFPPRFLHTGRPGAYLRIIQDGVLADGNTITTGPAPAHGLTVGEINRIYATERHEAARLFEASEALPTHWRAWALRRLERHPEDRPRPRTRQER